MKSKLLYSVFLTFLFLPGNTSPSLTLHSDKVPDYQPPSKIRIRIFTESAPDFTIFSVCSGKYVVNTGTGSITAGKDEMLIIARNVSKIIVKKRNGEIFICDSVDFRGSSPDDSFYLQLPQSRSSRRFYSGDLKCFSDMEKLLLINCLDIEKYITGVVKAEGGSRKNEEYFKTQSIIARTYTYKYFNKHILDKYNLCDDTHCQAFNGLVEDSLIINAVKNTRGMVITTPDSILIISAFHSNCGGETSPSEYAWVTSQSYLRPVSDPYCQASTNALWMKKISVEDWTGYLKKNGFHNNPVDPSSFSFVQPARAPDYVTGSFTMPLRTIRNDFDLRSTYFSVSVVGDSLILKGRGYGHGVGLCQEGAMVMASKGFTCKQIIDFYYSGIKLLLIDDARKDAEEKVTLGND